jgi:hypothetical protein
MPSGRTGAAAIMPLVRGESADSLRTIRPVPRPAPVPHPKPDEAVPAEPSSPPSSADARVPGPKEDEPPVPSPPAEAADPVAPAWPEARTPAPEPAEAPAGERRIAAGNAIAAVTRADPATPEVAGPVAAPAAVAGADGTGEVADGDVGDTVTAAAGTPAKPDVVPAGLLGAAGLLVAVTRRIAARSPGEPTTGAAGAAADEPPADTVDLAAGVDATAAAGLSRGGDPVPVPGAGTPADRPPGRLGPAGAADPVDPPAGAAEPAGAATRAVAGRASDRITTGPRAGEFRVGPAASGSAAAAEPPRPPAHAGGRVGPATVEAGWIAVALRMRRSGLPGPGSRSRPSGTALRRSRDRPASQDGAPLATDGSTRPGVSPPGPAGSPAGDAPPDSPDPANPPAAGADPDSAKPRPPAGFSATPAAAPARGRTGVDSRAAATDAITRRIADTSSRRAIDPPAGVGVPRKGSAASLAW